MDALARLRDISIWFAPWHCQGVSAKNFSRPYAIVNNGIFSIIAAMTEARLSAFLTVKFFYSRRKNFRWSFEG